MQSLYSDVRQLIIYIKEAHGGVFRRVLLSGLIDVASRPHRKETKTQTTRVIRYSVIYKYSVLYTLTFLYFYV